MLYFIQDVNISEEMIKRQFAVRDMSSPPQEQGQGTVQKMILKKYFTFLKSRTIETKQNI